MSYQDYHIILSSDLELTPEEFAAAWNANPECRTISEAKLIQGKSYTFEPITLTVILITVGTGFAANVLSDLVKNLIQKVHENKQQALQQQNLPPTQRHRQTHTEVTRKPDGTYTLIVDTDEE